MNSDPFVTNILKFTISHKTCKTYIRLLFAFRFFNKMNFKEIFSKLSSIWITVHDMYNSDYDFDRKVRFVISEWASDHNKKMF